MEKYKTEFKLKDRHPGNTGTTSLNPHALANTDRA